MKTSLVPLLLVLTLAPAAAQTGIGAPVDLGITGAGTTTMGAYHEPFVPFTISQSDYQAIQNWLGEQPAKFSIPVLTWLQGLERKAQEDAGRSSGPNLNPAR